MKRASLSVAMVMFAGAGFLLLQVGKHAGLTQRPTTQSRPVTANSRIATPDSQLATARFARQPMRFEANMGQTDRRVDYLARGKGYTLFLAGGDAVLKLRTSPPVPNPRSEAGLEDARAAGRESDPPETGAVLRLSLAGASGKAAASGEGPLPGGTNYLSGANPSHWRTNITNYARVRYRGVYPGIDVLYHASDASLEYDFDVAPGADPSAIRLKLAGAQRTEVGASGDLVAHVGGGEVHMHRPVIYQETPHGRTEISGGYTMLAGNEAGFHLGPYDRSLPLVIDPTLAFSTYLGGDERELLFGLALDGDDNVYVCGTTYSTNFPTTVGAFQTSYAGNEDAFVSKLNAAGNTLIYSTYFGGSGLDICDMIAVNSTGNAYITGETTSQDFPITSSAFQKHFNGTKDAFVTELNPTGTGLVYSSYLGGIGRSFGYGLTLDAAGDAYVTGYTISPNFPTVNPIQGTLAGKQDAFITEVNPSGTGLVYSTYLGGTDADIGYMIAVDSTGAAYVGGTTVSDDFPTASPVQGTNHGITNGFVAGIKPLGAGLIFSTYLGGSIRDGVIGLGIDGAANVYVTGVATSPDFPLVNDDGRLRGRRDAFVTAFAAGGQSIMFSRYVGGGSVDFAESIWVDSRGDSYITGCTRSTNFPLKDPIQSNYAGGSKAGDAFITELSRTGAYVFSTYLGGSDDDAGYGIAVDLNRNIYVAGRTSSTDFPLVNPLQGTYGGTGDAWVALIAH